MSGINQDSSYIWTSTFAFLFFGHIVDNVRDVRWLFIVLEIASSFWFIIMGAVFFYDSHNPGLTEPLGRSLFPFNFFFVAGLQIIQIIQLFNWFSKRRLSTVIGIWYLVQQFGFFLRFEIENPCPIDKLLWFPYITDLFNSADGWLFVSVGVLFFFLAVFDAYSWVYHPF
jgi:hypothetical protein